MAERVSVGEMASAIMESLEEYADLATEDLKKAVRSAGNTVKKEIRENAPKRTGAYGKSWAVKVSKETSNSLEVTVYSRNLATQKGAAAGWPGGRILPRRRMWALRSWKRR